MSNVVPFKRSPGGVLKPKIRRMAIEAYQNTRENFINELCLTAPQSMFIESLIPKNVDFRVPTAPHKEAEITVLEEEVVSGRNTLVLPYDADMRLRRQLFLQHVDCDDGDAVIYNEHWMAATNLGSVAVKTLKNRVNHRGLEDMKGERAAIGWITQARFLAADSNQKTIGYGDNSLHDDSSALTELYDNTVLPERILASIVHFALSADGLPDFSNELANSLRRYVSQNPYNTSKEQLVSAARVTPFVDGDLRSILLRVK